MLRNLFNGRGNKIIITENLDCQILLDISKSISSLNPYNTLWGKQHYLHVPGHEKQPLAKYRIYSIVNKLNKHWTAHFWKTLG